MTWTLTAQIALLMTLAGALIDLVGSSLIEKSKK